MSIEKSDSILHELIAVNNLISESCNITSTIPAPEAESKEYGAYTFTMNQKEIRYRVAKITPTKTGQFVTLWKRNKSGIIEPFEHSDKFDLIVIGVRKDKRAGQFVFIKSILEEKGIITTSTKEGKRAMRVYPPWDKALNKQAEKTQQWQLDFFLEIPKDTPLDIVRATKLYSND